MTGNIGAALRAVAEALEALPSPGMIIGGIAVILHGVPRVTRDIDATVDGNGVELDDLVRRLAQHAIWPRISDAVGFARTSQVLLLRHEPTGIDVDLSIAWLPFELEAIAARQQLSRGTLRAAVARPEDLVIYKAIAWRPQDRQDIERLLGLHAKAIDLQRVRTIVSELAAALDESARPAELEALVRAALDQEE